MRECVNERERVCVCVGVCVDVFASAVSYWPGVCVREKMCVCVCLRVFACVCVCLRVFV